MLFDFQNLTNNYSLKPTLFLFSFLMCGSLFSQNTEAYITYGTQFLSYELPSDDIDGFSNSGRWPINYDKPGRLAVSSGKKSFLTSNGIITAGYNVRKDKHVFGALFTYEKQLMSHKTNVFNLGTIDVGVVDGEVMIINQGLEAEFVGLNSWSDSDIKNYNLAARYDYNWIFKDKLKVYSGISLGAGLRRYSTIYYNISEIQDLYPDEVLEDFLREKDTELNYHLHLNLAGVRFGHIWAVVAEIGYGHRGFVNVGVNHLLFASQKWIDKKAAKKMSK